MSVPWKRARASCELWSDRETARRCANSSDQIQWSYSVARWRFRSVTFEFAPVLTLPSTPHAVAAVAKASEVTVTAYPAFHETETAIEQTHDAL